MPRKNREYRVRLVGKDANPFIPDVYAFLAQFTIYTIKASNKKQIREWFREAKGKDFPSVRGKRIAGIEEIK